MKNKDPLNSFIPALSEAAQRDKKDLAHERLRKVGIIISPAFFNIFERVGVPINQSEG